MISCRLYEESVVLFLVYYFSTHDGSQMAAAPELERGAGGSRGPRVSIPCPRRTFPWRKTPQPKMRARTLGPGSSVLAPGLRGNRCRSERDPCKPSPSPPPRREFNVNSVVPLQLERAKAVDHRRPNKRPGDRPEDRVAWRNDAKKGWENLSLPRSSAQSGCPSPVDPRPLLLSFIYPLALWQSADSKASGPNGR